MTRAEEVVDALTTIDPGDTVTLLRFANTKVFSTRRWTAGNDRGVSLNREWIDVKSDHGDSIYVWLDEVERAS